MKKDLVLIGGGGHCHSVIGVAEQSEDINIVGILDKDLSGRKNILGYPLLGDDLMINELTQKGCEFLITVGQIKSSALRKKIFDQAITISARFATLVSKSAFISSHTEIGEGTVIMPGAVVNAGAKIGRNCIINSQSLIEHDAVIGDHVHVSTGAIVNGDCRVGDGSFIGSRAVLKNGISVGLNCIVSFGSTVSKDVENEQLYRS